MKVIDNFLSIPDFDKLHQHFFQSNFNWFFNDSIACDKQGLDQYQFVHPFFDITKPSLTTWSPILQPILDKLKAKYVFRIKANCRPRTTQGVLSDYHTDMNLNQQTAIFYLNTNNGYTKFQSNDYPDVKSVANRLVTFHGNLKHSGCSCTDSHVRVVLNINYIPDIPNFPP